MSDPSRAAESAGRPACTTELPAAWPYDELLLPREGLLVVLSGPSGAGKDAVIARLEASGFPFTRVVTATCRPIRLGEVPGKSYHFLTPEEFARWRAEGKLLEWAEVYGVPYGTPIDDVRRALAAGETVLLKIDVQGAAQVKQKAPAAVFIYLGPGSFEELVHRLARRGTESEAVFQRRVQQAREELRQVPLYDYLVINRQGELGCAVDQVQAIITAERLRVHPRQIRLG
ncbi:MAG TPA: guanylate kinase [Chloroflexota bacterium]|nr:guanylate kinase [Chloroflexota bacterium]